VIKTLYAVMRAVQRLAKETMSFLVPPLEGLWWVDDDRPALEVPREQWRWQLLLILRDEAATGSHDAARERGREGSERRALRPNLLGHRSQKACTHGTSASVVQEIETILRHPVRLLDW
jgi:hypothetical protein